MSIKPEERPKLIGLVSAIGVVILYFVFAVIPKLSAAQSKPTLPDGAASSATAGAAAPAPAAGVPPAAGGPAVPAAPGPPDGVLLASIAKADPPPAPVAARDPFDSAVTTPIGAAAAPVPAPPAHAAAVPAPAVTASRSGPAAPPALASGHGEPVPVAPPPAVTLMGVVAGHPAIAVFELDGAAEELHEGDLLKGAYRVVTIDENGVLLGLNGKRFRLEVGQSNGGATPAR